MLELLVELGEVRAQTVEQNGLDRFALIEEHGSGELNGRVHRKISVGDDFEPSAGFGYGMFWAAGRRPRQISSAAARRSWRSR